MAKKAKRKRDANRNRVRHRNLCAHFDGFELAGSAKAGLGALLAKHKPLVVEHDLVSCSVELDGARRSAEPSARRWDYVLTVRSSPAYGVGMEVHPAIASEVEEMIGKKEWAEKTVARMSKGLSMRSWHWIIPPGATPALSRNDPKARLLALAGIEFPTSRLSLR